jgi:hypothetical protein
MKYCRDRRRSGFGRGRDASIFLSAAGAPSLRTIAAKACAVLHSRDPRLGLGILSPRWGEVAGKLLETKMMKPKKKTKQDRPNNRKAKLKAKGRRRRVRAS